MSAASLRSAGGCVVTVGARTAVATVRLVTGVRPEFRASVEAVVRGLRAGEVVSYGDVAAQAGYPGAARAVGRVMASSDGLPWWRVIMHDGRMAPGKEADQGRRLRAEGVDVRDGRVAGSVRGSGRSGASATGHRAGERRRAEQPHRGASDNGSTR